MQVYPVKTRAVLGLGLGGGTLGGAFGTGGLIGGGITGFG
jgi:hypothetical protein